jgi:CheY-like chemotaxis protein
MMATRESANTRVLRRYLHSWGCRTEGPIDSAKLIPALKEAASLGDAYKLALVDIDMPEMDSAGIGRMIKADAQVRDTLLISMTSAPMRGDGLGLRESGFAGYLHKPIRPSELFDTMIMLFRQGDKHDEELVTRHRLAEQKSPSKASKPRVLLAEDNVVNQRMALKLLEKAGMQADVVGNGKEAVSAVDRTAYDLILMDCQMPEMDGYEATAEIRRREGSVRHTPICALTANAMSGDREKCLAAGMDDYISKPVSLDELQKAIKRLLGQEAGSIR